MNWHSLILLSIPTGVSLTSIWSSGAASSLWWGFEGKSRVKRLLFFFLLYVFKIEVYENVQLGKKEGLKKAVLHHVGVCGAEDKMPYFEVYCALYIALLGYCSLVAVNTMLKETSFFFFFL